MTGFTLFRALGIAGAVRAGTTGATARTLTTAMGQAKADKQYDEQDQWRDVAFHGLIIDPQSP